MVDSRRNLTILLVFALGAVALGLLFNRLDRRPDLTDPAEIAKLPGYELRDVEIERLVQAAFLEAESVHIKSEAAPSITVTDPTTLRALADRFAIGRDDEQLPRYRHPGLEYTEITFDGPYTPRLGFTGPTEVILMSDKPGRWRRFGVPTRFARTLADLLRLK